MSKLQHHQGNVEPESECSANMKERTSDSARSPLHPIDSNTLSSKGMHVSQSGDNSLKDSKPVHSSLFRRHRLLWITSGTILVAGFIGWSVSQRMNADSRKLLAHQCRTVVLHPSKTITDVWRHVHTGVVHKTAALRSITSHDIKHELVSLSHDTYRLLGNCLCVAMQKLHGMGSAALSMSLKKSIEFKDKSINELNRASVSLSHLAQNGLEALYRCTASAGRKLVKHLEAFSRNVLYPAFEQVAQKKIMLHDSRAGSGLITLEEIKKFCRTVEGSVRQFFGTVVYSAAQIFVEEKAEERRLLILEGTKIIDQLVGYGKACRDVGISVLVMLTAYMNALGQHVLLEVKTFLSLVEATIKGYISFLERRVQTSIDAAVLNLRREYKQIYSYLHSTTIGKLILRPMN